MPPKLDNYPPKPAIETAQDRIKRLLAPLTQKIELSDTETDDAGHPVGSSASKLHMRAKKIRENNKREKLLVLLKEKAELTGNDMELARKLGIDLGRQDDDPLKGIL